MPPSIHHAKQRITTPANKQAAAIPIAILSYNIGACKEIARIIESSRREVKPLLADKPFNITPHNKPSPPLNHSPTTVMRGILHHQPLGAGTTRYAPSRHAQNHQPKKL
jgi:hypothetical protein